MGTSGGFGRGHYMPHDFNQSFRNRLATGSLYMDPEEIDSILRIQWKSLHSGSPYVEDYYYLVSQLGLYTLLMHLMQGSNADISATEMAGRLGCVVPECRVVSLQARSRHGKVDYATEHGKPATR